MITPLTLADPIADALRRYREAESAGRPAPVCALCGASLVGEEAVYLWRRWLCDDCLADARRHCYSSEGKEERNEQDH